jgi:hypothetical protein
MRRAFASESAPPVTTPRKRRRDRLPITVEGNPLLDPREVRRNQRAEHEELLRRWLAERGY